MIRWIKSHQEYMDFMQAAKACRTEHFYAPTLPSPEGLALGITISKKVGKAVQRNRLKRRIKAWCIMHPEDLATQGKMNLIARKGAAELSWEQLSAELCQLMRSV
ncbi:MAG: ribonuclease P protein component [Candidatus Cloacimonetes bacterium]|jgi:ribonuclease P protein component|nr:ribonuclease P protein component [Candidatus Cloacimonadota bacterium]MDY0337075.1 ribonuclease P protein component [Candidatus Cloacimonadaceae bacterium]MDD2682725.1 ribonuclease P protein component [Candidatus Cloacimonadota bacterium]MDD3097731.1 ribonuclease P protein component [Candidatus Cloacimonadota bacterium]MDD4035467.1 ribonuclease P protein component [Candidatus Cloacimonadota bacterium]